MKNLLTYINPSKNFNEEHKILAKIQIDNSLDLGWKKEDILLVTNFPYKYNGVKALVIGDDVFYAPLPPTTKLYAILNLIDQGVIGKDLYWYHDFDAYQFNPIAEAELELGSFDMAVTNYGRMPRLCSASIFFKKSAGDIFGWIRDLAEKYNRNEEVAITWLRNSNEHNFNSRVKQLNITYAFHRFNLPRSYKTADKPIKVAHFHPASDKLDIFMYGKNEINKILMPERLKKIFHYHGIK